MLHNALHRVALLAIILQFLHGKRNIGGSGLRVQLMQHDQVAAVLVREGPQEDSVHQTENRGVRADPQRQRQDRSQGKRRVLAQYSYSIANILQESFDEAAGPRVAAFVLERLDATDAQYGFAPRLFRAEASGDVQLRLTIQVIAQLGI